MCAVRAPAVGKRRGGPTLERSETDKAVAFVREVCADQRHPTKFLTKAMGCSPRTARRLLSSSAPYSSLMKRSYIVAFAASVGCPLETVTQPVDVEYIEALAGWMTTNPASLATKVAAALGAGIATRAMRVFNMPTDFTVAHGPDGRPASVRVDITAVIGRKERHGLVVAASSLTGGLLLTHLDESGAQRCQVTPSADAIDRILKSIKHEQKNITTKRVR